MLWIAMTICASAVASTMISALTYRLWRSRFRAVACGGLIPALAILGASFLLGAHGPFHAYIGRLLALLSLLIGFPAAIWMAKER